MEVLTIVNKSSVVLGFCLVLFAILYIVFYNRRSKLIAPRDEFGSKAVFITGCDSGIGYECAILCDKLGFKVYAGCLFPDGDGAKRLLSTTQHVRVLDLDITDDDKVRRAYDLTRTELQQNGLWCLINNAGVLNYGDFEWLKWEQIEMQIDVNLFGTIRVTKTFLPLIKKGKGRIVTMSSINGLLSYPLQSVYCATKFALEGFCDSLRYEQKRNGVHVICMQLGDFSKLTNIMSNHERHALDMWNAMSKELRDEEHDYFWKIQDVVRKNLGVFSRTSFDDSRLYVDIQDVLVSSKPRSRYMCMPLKQKLILKFLLLLPRKFVDAFVAFIFEKMTK